MTEVAIWENKDKHFTAMQLILDDKLYDRTTSIAARMAKAVGFTPKHLIGQPEACYAVVTRSIMWGLDPFSVALATYSIGGKVGFEGKLCHAILERSGRFEGRIQYEMIGDWTKIQGKFTMRDSVKKKDDEGTPSKYAAKNWNDADEEGLGVKILARLKGEVEPQVFVFMLRQAQPRNSTLWVLDPVTQIKYLAIRRFANSVVPDIFMGVPFDIQDDEPIKDVTPKPIKERRQADEINEILNAQTSNEPVKNVEPVKTVEANPEPEERPAESGTLNSLFPTTEVLPVALTMPSGEVCEYPTKIDTIDLVAVINDMMPSDVKPFVSINRAALPKVIKIMREDGQIKSAETLENLLK